MHNVVVLGLVGLAYYTLARKLLANPHVSFELGCVHGGMSDTSVAAPPTPRDSAPLENWRRMESSYPTILIRWTVVVK